MGNEMDLLHKSEKFLFLSQTIILFSKIVPVLVTKHKKQGKR